MAFHVLIFLLWKININFSNNFKFWYKISVKDVAGVVVRVLFPKNLHFELRFPLTVHLLFTIRIFIRKWTYGMHCNCSAILNLINFKIIIVLN